MVTKEDFFFLLQGFCLVWVPTELLSPACPPSNFSGKCYGYAISMQRSGDLFLKDHTDALENLLIASYPLAGTVKSKKILPILITIKKNNNLL